MSQTERKKAEPSDLLPKSSTKNRVVKKPMWECPVCKPRLWFGDLEKLKVHVQQKHPELGKPETKTTAEITQECCNYACRTEPPYNFPKPDLKKKWVSEAAHQAEVREVEANEFKAIKLAEKVVGENAKLKTEIENLKIENSDLMAVDVVAEYVNLKERLEAIKQHIGKLPTWEEARQKSTATNKVEEEQIPAHLILIDMWNDWARELGVLLSTKELDQKTREGDSK